MTKLLPFDENAACPKCGGSDIGIHYYERARPLDDAWYNKNIDGEYLNRCCRRCHYEWQEAVVSLGAGKKL